MEFRKIIDEIILKDRPLSEEGRELVIMEIMEHQKYLRKETARVTIIQLTRLDNKTLAIMLDDAFRLFAFRFFAECGKKPETSYKDTWFLM